jgi:hypothetical protein
MVARMRQRCELCEALGCRESARVAQLVGIWVGARDALLCPDHALFALDSDVTSLAELTEVYRFVHDEHAALSGKRARRAGSPGVQGAHALGGQPRT